MDTIELLETIGSDASLRYAAADELQGVLANAQASAELAEAVTSGNVAPLRRELKLQQSTQVEHLHAPGHEDDDEDESPEPEQVPDNKPN